MGNRSLEIVLSLCVLPFVTFLKIILSFATTPYNIGTPTLQDIRVDSIVGLSL